MPSHQPARPEPKTSHKAELILSTLIRASESDRRQFLHKQSLPDFLYKFRKVDLEKPGRLEDIIIRSNLFLSSPTSFNDPFDMKPLATAEGDVASLLNKIDSLPAPSAKAKRDAKKRARTVWQEQGIDGIAREFKIEEVVQSLFADTGVFCFSTIGRKSSRDTGPRNTLMWSHYGDSHRGICLQFQVSKDPRILRNLVRVSYTDNYPTINWLSSKHHEECLSAATNKHSKWSYEHEWRYVRLNSANTKVQFSPCFLAGIILGAKVDEATITEINRLLTKRQEAGLPPIKKYKAHAEMSSYKIRIFEWH
jgi:hypothetical protein